MRFEPMREPPKRRAVRWRRWRSVQALIYLKHFIAAWFGLLFRVVPGKRAFPAPLS